MKPDSSATASVEDAVDSAGRAPRKGALGRAFALNWPWLCLVTILASCQPGQRADPAFHPIIPQPTYPAGTGPIVWIDEAHHNVVSTVGRYAPFVATLRADGYVVRNYRESFTSTSLDTLTVLVIGNALHASNIDNWSLPAPGAFDPSEIQAVHAWVIRGGALLILVDHMPFPGAAAELAAAFGVEFLNGYVEDPDTWDPVVFRRSEGTLLGHALADGLDSSQRVDSAGTFDGSAFRLATGGDPLLLLGSRHVSYHPQKSWDIDASTPKLSAEGWLQGAALEVGAGRVVIFADATMFSAQIGPARGAKLGMNTPQGAGNLQLLRNVLRWLTRYQSPRVSG